MGRLRREPRGRGGVRRLWQLLGGLPGVRREHALDLLRFGREALNALPAGRDSGSGREGGGGISFGCRWWARPVLC